MYHVFDNIPASYFANTFITELLIRNVSSTDSIRHGSSLHHLHGSDQPVPWRPVLVGPLLPDAVHPRHRLSIRDPGRSGHIHSGYEAIPEPSQGVFDRRVVPSMLSVVYGLRSRRWQLYFSTLRHVQRELPVANHRVLRVYRHRLRLWCEEVS